MNEPWWRTLLREQQGSGFADFAGAAAAVTLPVSDRLVTRIVASRLPRSVPVREVMVKAEANNTFSVGLRLAKPSFLPPLTLRFVIVRQPVLPDSPLLVLGLASQGLAALAGPLVRFFSALPPWIRLDNDRAIVDVGALLQQQGVSDVLRHLTHLELTTAPGVFIVHARGGVPPASHT